MIRLSPSPYLNQLEKVGELEARHGDDLDASAQSEIEDDHHGVHVEEGQHSHEHIIVNVKLDGQQLNIEQLSGKSTKND